MKEDDLTIVGSHLYNMCKLANISEHIHSISKRRAHEKRQNSAPSQLYLHDAVDKLEKSGMSLEIIRSELASQTSKIIFTDHLTQALRRFLLANLLYR